MANRDAFDEGYDAYWDGIAAEDNPYDQGTEESHAWNEGWQKARQHDLDERDG